MHPLQCRGASLPLLSLILSATFLLISCASDKSILQADSYALHDTYRLLQQVVEDEARVDKLMWIKTASPAVSALAKDIAQDCEKFLRELNRYGETHGIKWHDRMLPAAERAVRSSLGKTSRSELLKYTGHDFDTRLLASQLEALNYVTHLTRQAQEQETNASQRKYLAKKAKEMQALRDRTFRLLAGGQH